MCTTCGCSDDAKLTLTRLDQHSLMRPHHHDHDHDHSHSHSNSHWGRDAETLKLEADILGKNDRLAQANRDWLAERGILALNLVSSPGSGKTTLLETTLKDLSADMPFAVIEGDQQTLLDAQRIQAAGCPVVQLNTGAGCHLEADMLAKGLEELRPQTESVVMIENVGNLVCPALFDLGEYAKVAILSVTEGEDKPLKYPHMFRASQLMLINKVDLLPYVNFSVERCVDYARQVNPEIEVLQVSATTGEGLQAWYDWLDAHRTGLLAQDTHPQQEASKKALGEGVSQTS